MRNIATEIYAEPQIRFRVVTEKLMKDGTSKRTGSFRRCDGSEFIANLYLKTVRDPVGNQLYIDGIVEDITDRIRAEEELHLLNVFRPYSSKPVPSVTFGR